MLNHLEYVWQWVQIIRTATRRQITPCVKQIMHPQFDPVEALELNYAAWHEAIDAFDCGLITRFDIKRWLECLT